MKMSKWAVLFVVGCLALPGALGGCITALEESEELEEDDFDGEDAEDGEEMYEGAEPASSSSPPASSGKPSEFEVTNYAETWDVRKF